MLWGGYRWHVADLVLRTLSVHAQHFAAGWSSLCNLDSGSTNFFECSDRFIFGFFASDAPDLTADLRCQLSLLRLVELRPSTLQ